MRGTRRAARQRAIENSVRAKYRGRFRSGGDRLPVIGAGGRDPESGRVMCWCGAGPIGHHVPPGRTFAPHPVDRPVRPPPEPDPDPRWRDAGSLGAYDETEEALGVYRPPFGDDVARRRAAAEAIGLD